VSRSLSYWDMLEGVLKGVVAAAVPGLHPMIFGSEEPYTLGLMYGVFMGMSVYLSGKGIYHAETAGGTAPVLRNLLMGIGLGLLLIPVAYFLYGVELPRIVVFFILLTGALFLLKEAPVAFLLSSTLGLIVLRFPVTVVSPLSSGLFYLFGLLFVLGGEVATRVTDWKRGVLASLLTYVPALPPSTWARLLGNSDVSVAAALSPLFSLVALTYGKTRSAMAAYVEYPHPEILFLVGTTYLLAFLATVSLLELLRAKRVSLPRELGLGIMAGHAALFGLGNLLLLVAATAAVLLSERKPAAYFGFIITPTLLYYA